MQCLSHPIVIVKYLTVSKYLLDWVLLSRASTALLTHDIDVIEILSVRLSVCPSLTLRYCIETP